MAPLTIHVQTYSDTSCPWCYVGKVALDRAMEAYAAQHPEVRFELSWNPFYLFPEAEVSAYDKTAYFTNKFGPAGAPAVLARVRREAAALGLPLTLEGRTGNTRDSHLLLLLAQRRSQGHLAALQAALFGGVFERGRDVSDRGFLLEAAAEAGLVGRPPGGGEGKGAEGQGDGDGDGEDEVLAWLDGEEGRALVDGLERRAKAVVGIAAVPSFVVQGRYRVGGKQGEGVFLDLFERIRREEGGGVREDTEKRDDGGEGVRH